jgi:hypothetical protein
MMKMVMVRGGKGWSKNNNIEEEDNDFEDIVEKEEIWSGNDAAWCVRIYDIYM